MTLLEIFEAFNRLKVLIVGDVMIDAYLWGKVDRISPEAPVPVVNVTHRDKRLGGAANVALNVQALGATPMLCSIVGNDIEADIFLALLRDQHLHQEGIVKANNRPTTVKNRILSGSQHLLRIDSETDKPIDVALTQQLFDRIAQLIPQCNVIIFEDYDKGVITPELISQTIALAEQHNIPTIVDPKKRNFLHYRNCTLFKPNLKELKEGLKQDFAPTYNDLQKAVALLREKTGVKNALITLSENGVFIDYEQQTHWIGAHKREIADVSGAGDTVASVAALCLALGLDAYVIAALANLSGGLVCEHSGVVPIDKRRFLQEAQDKVNLII